MDEPLMKRLPARLDDRKILQHLKAERTQRIADANKPANKAEERKARYNETRLLLFAMFAACLTYGLFFIYTPQNKHKTILLTVGQYGAQSQTAFIDTTADDLFFTTLNKLVVNCTPPITDPVVSQIMMGSMATTNAAWAAIIKAVNFNAANRSKGCYFYGLKVASVRANSTVGPVDICQGMVHVGIDMFRYKYNNTIPPNITSILNIAFNAAYPMNIFWKYAPNAAVLKQQVIAQAYNILQCITSPVTLSGCGNTNSNNIDVKQLSLMFCNQYFASDQMSYYNAALMPWLSFPFPGLMQRNSQNVFSDASKQMLSVQRSIIINNVSVITVTPLQAIYIVGDVLNVDPAMELLIDALFANIPVLYPPTYTVADITAFLLLIRQEANDLPDGEAILIVARYSQNINMFNSLNFMDPFSNQKVFFVFSNIIRSGDNFTTSRRNIGLINLELRNAAKSWQAMNMVDFNTTLPFDRIMSPGYIKEKFVAQFMVSAFNNLLITSMNRTIQLLDTWSLGNVLINGEDLGGNIDALIRDKQLQDSGLTLGFQNLPLDQSNRVQYLSPTDTFGGAFGAASTVTLPESFDLRSGSLGRCVRPNFNQGSGDDCWSQATVFAQSNRFCLQGKTPNWAPLSIHHVTSCSGDAGTNGNSPSHPIVAFDFLYDKGAVDEQCFPSIVTPPCSRKPCPEQPCVETCSPTVTSYQKFTDDRQTARYYQIGNLNQFMQELYTRGSFPSCFDVPTDFYDFFTRNPTGCYNNNNPKVSGGHCVMALGWDKNNLYFRNSWGTSFANNGDFCVQKGLQVQQATYWFENTNFAAVDGDVQIINIAEPIPITDPNEIPVVIPPDAEPVNPVPAPPVSAASGLDQPIIELILMVAFVVSVLILTL